MSKDDIQSTENKEPTERIAYNLQDRKEKGKKWRKRENM